MCAWSRPTRPSRAARVEGQVLRLPIAHGEGQLLRARPRSLDALEASGRVVFRYATPRGRPPTTANPNGSLDNIAGICSERRNVVGLMPHPERACETPLGSADGLVLFESVVDACRSRHRCGGGTMSPAFDRATLDRHGITPDEYERIVALVGREPNLTELGLFSVMWSEHCSYKSSRVHLKTLPTEGPRVLQGPGENAGAVDIGDGLAAVFKIESHNHPSFIEPYQGAATGRRRHHPRHLHDGRAANRAARLASVRPLDDAADAPDPRGASSSGIAGYGNSIGIPTVGGEVMFDESYSGNPLVNVFCLGIARQDAIVKGQAAASAIPCTTSARRRAATGFTARRWRRRSSTRSRPRNGRPCRSAIPSWRSCCSRRALK